MMSLNAVLLAPQRQAGSVRLCISRPTNRHSVTVLPPLAKALKRRWRVLHTVATGLEEAATAAVSVDHHKFFLTVMGMGILASLATGTAHGLSQAVGIFSSVLAASLEAASGRAGDAAPTSTAADARQTASSVLQPLAEQVAGQVEGSQLQVKVKVVQVATVALGTLITAAHLMERLTLGAAEMVRQVADAAKADAAAAAASAAAVDVPGAKEQEQEESAVAASLEGDLPVTTEEQQEAVQQAAKTTEDLLAPTVAVVEGEAEEQPQPCFVGGRQLVAGSWASGSLADGRPMAVGSWELSREAAGVVPVGEAADAAAAVELAAAAVQLANIAVEVAEAVGATKEDEEEAIAKAAAAADTAMAAARDAEGQQVAEERSAMEAVAEQVEQRQAAPDTGFASEEPAADLNGDAVRPGMNVEETTKDVEGWIAAWHDSSEQEQPTESTEQPSSNSQTKEKLAPQAGGSDGGEDAAAAGAGEEAVAAARPDAEEEVVASPAAATAIVRVTEPSLPFSAAALFAAITADTPVAAALVWAAGSPPAVSGTVAEGAVLVAAEEQTMQQGEPEPEPVLAAALVHMTPATADPTPQEQEAAYKARIAAVLAESKLTAAHVHAAAASSIAAADTQFNSQSRHLQQGQAFCKTHLAMRSKHVDCLQGTPFFRAATSPKQQHQAKQEELLAHSNRILQGLVELEAAERQQQEATTPSRFGRIASVAQRMWQVLLGLCLLVLAGLTAVFRAVQQGAEHLADSLTGISTGDNSSSATANPAYTAPTGDSYYAAPPTSAAKLITNPRG